MNGECLELKLNLVLTTIHPTIHLEVAFCIQGLLHNAAFRVLMDHPTCFRRAEAQMWLTQQSVTAYKSIGTSLVLSLALCRP